MDTRSTRNVRLSKLRSLPTTDMTPRSSEKPEDASKRNCAHRALSTPWFEIFFLVIIVANVVVMIIETDHLASEGVPADGELPWTEVFGLLALTLFVFEMVLRLIAFKSGFWGELWNVCDFCIVAMDVLMTVASFIGADFFPVSVLRTLRLMKLLRVTKILHAFPELRMLLAGLLSSLWAMLWGTILLGLFLLVFAMVAVHVIHPVNKGVDHDGCDRCSAAYSSVFESIITLFQAGVIGDGWGELILPIIQKHPITLLFFGPLYMSIGMAVMNLILGVVVNSAHKAYEHQQALEETKDALARIEKETDVLEEWHRLDVDCNGELSRDELYQAFKQEGTFHDLCLQTGITEEDFDIAWEIIDADRSGAVSYKEFLGCLTSMKSSDTTFLLTYVKVYLSWMKTALAELINRQDVQMLRESFIKVMQERPRYSFGSDDSPCSDDIQVAPEHTADEIHM